jgi:trans-aconitate 2-methyltransferase
LSWDPGQYLKYAAPRLRPALDLLQRIGDSAPREIYDLGCGAGNVTQALVERWPQARVTGVDSSPEMLALARRALPAARFVQAALERWQPELPPDVIYSNAALQWLDDHRALFPQLFALLAPGGVLAVQMPRNHQEPSHRLIERVANDGPWRAVLAPLLRTSPTAPPEIYYDLLAPHAAQLDIWETIYLQVLEGDNPVVGFTKGSALKPLLDALPDDARAEFERRYATQIRAAYPPRADGRTLFPFRRLFLIARKG